MWSIRKWKVKALRRCARRLLLQHELVHLESEHHPVERRLSGAYSSLIVLGMHLSFGQQS
jgi:hypothetical protein